MTTSLLAGSSGYSFFMTNTALLVPPRTMAQRNISISGCIAGLLHIGSVRGIALQDRRCSDSTGPASPESPQPVGRTDHRLLDMALGEPPAMPRVAPEAVDHHCVHRDGWKTWLRLDDRLAFQGCRPLGRGHPD